MTVVEEVVVLVVVVIVPNDKGMNSSRRGEVSEGLTEEHQL